MKKTTYKKFEPKVLILIVYQTKNKNWRGFCFPFNITCEAFDKDAAFKKLEKMVYIYIEGLKKYNYPKHLCIRKLSEKQDRIIFSKVINEITKKIKENLLNYRVEEKRRKEEERKKWEIILNNPVTFGYYSNKHLLPC